MMISVGKDKFFKLILKNSYLLKNSKILNHRCYWLTNNSILCKNNQYNSILNDRLAVGQKWNHQSFFLMSTKSTNKRIYFSWKSFLISGVIVTIFAAVMLQMKNEKLRKMERQRKKALGETAIGGKFDLIDQDGKRFTSYDLEGKWAMIYFGFTHCPDVCPDELEKIVKAVQLISSNKNAEPIQPVFITVDPERDSVSAVREYIREFSPNFIGLTGSKEQVDQATRAYRVYYSAGPRDHENDYIVDHTIITYLINPEGQLVDYYGQTKTAEDVANGVLKAMTNYRATNKRLGFI